MAARPGGGVSSSARYRRAGPRGGGGRTAEDTVKTDGERTSRDERQERIAFASQIDERMDFKRFESGKPRVGWLINMHSTVLFDEETAMESAAVDYYFLTDDGTGFLATMRYEPYFLVAAKQGFEAEVEESLRKVFSGLITRIEKVSKRDLDMPNHLVVERRDFIKICFRNSSDLLAVRRVLLPIVEQRKKNQATIDTYAAENMGYGAEDGLRTTTTRIGADQLEYITDIREYDVPYHARVAIDLDIRVGKWYSVSARQGTVKLTELMERVQRAEPVVMAFDIETTKLPLKFPDAQYDMVMMISYMIDGQGFLITNREIVSQDIEDFEYTPKPEFEGPFIVFNEHDEKALLERFFEHVKDAKPTVMVTYNGDFFDWPFIEARAAVHGISMYEEIGFQKDMEDEFKSTYCAHLDCFRWVKRDSYLPQGSQGLKAVTTAKLGYDPLELDPELMTPYAAEKPQVLAQYSVSDAVATYYLYMKYVHPFIFSLCNIIPLKPDEVLRKGTGTLCEMLLMVQAYKCDVVLPNKHVEGGMKFHEGHLLESETYVGGHVESLEAGVFRKDIPEKFHIQPDAIHELVDQLEKALKFTIEVEAKTPLESVTNFDEVYGQIKEALLKLSAEPDRSDCPKIYHLDVASMYPNIMVTNRLQPDSIKTDADCATCDFNVPGKTCDRRMIWSWRGEYFPASKSDYNMLVNALENETFPPKFPNGPSRSFEQLTEAEQRARIQKRLADYSKRVYHRLHESKTTDRETIVCQRENPFYVDTVKSFRDRRYDFKGLQKVWKRKVDEYASASDAVATEEAKKMVILYDSLQLAHKVILNSFYGYVMRKGSRWYSMEMAGVTCLTGATIIQMARQLVERIGRPLELDTDGIWCILPFSFPEDFKFQLKNGKPLFISYPCVMLNYLVHERFTNHQYSELVREGSFEYKVSSENSIFFEVDGPYRAMILPASKEEDKNLKKRYAVFNDDGSLAELKGFEVKRRGELKLVKTFQTQLFKVFLKGTTLQECYKEVAKVADKWIDVLHSRGYTMTDEELVDLVSENKSMSKSLEEYGNQKSTSISTAHRLGDFLGEQMIKGRGLNCKYIISAEPKSAPVTERAVPVDIFFAEEDVKRHFLRKWLKNSNLEVFDLREIIDWDYYMERLGSVVQKIISIPAAMQKIENPVPRVPLPAWLNRRVNERNSRFQQADITSMFRAIKPPKPMIDVTSEAINVKPIADLEDIGDNRADRILTSKVAKVSTTKRKSRHTDIKDPDEIVSNIGTRPSLDSAYAELLRFEKKRWRVQLQARRRRKQLFGDVSITSMPSSETQKRLQQFSSARWDIVYIEDTGIAGELKAQVWTCGRIENIRLRTPRSFYINFWDENSPALPIEGYTEESCKIILPNGRDSTNLREISMPETLFMANKGHVDAFLTHESVQGVYEYDIPRIIRTIIDKGCSWKFANAKPGSLPRGFEKGFQSPDFARQSSDNYLLGAKIGFVYVYSAKAGNRDVYALLGSGAKSIDVFIVTNDAENNTLPHPSRLYRSLYSELVRGKLDLEELYSPEVQFTCSVFRSHKKAYNAISKAASQFVITNKRQGPYFVVLESVNQRPFIERIRSLDNYPKLFLSGGQEKRFMSLNWQQEFLRQCIQHHFSIHDWIQHRIELARFANVPVANLPFDDVLFSTDVIFARKLKEQHVALWWRSRLQNQWHITQSHGGDMEICRPQLSTSVCIEMSVRNLAISGILNYVLMNEAEGSAIMSSLASFEEDDGCIGYGADPQAKYILVSVFKDMVLEWWKQSSAGDTRADRLVQHLERWTKSPQANLYSSVIFSFVQEITRKAFLRMSAEISVLGSKVIYGNASRFIIETQKPNIANALAYGSYIVKALRSKAIFNFLDLSIVEYWDILMWLDEVNFGGMSTRAITASSEQSVELTMSWHLKSFLPEIYQADLQSWVVEFIDQLHKLKTKQTLAERLLERTNSAQGLDDSYLGNGLVRDHFSPPLKKFVKRLQAQRVQSLVDGSAGHKYQVAKMPGFFRELSTSDHVRDFVVILMKLYSLYFPAEMEVRLLRKELLQILDIPEFSPSADYAYPCDRLLISQYPCAYCGTGIDLDLCRYEDLYPVIGESGNVASHAWRCLHCHNEIDRLIVEELLIEKLQTMLHDYQKQDLRCTKCKTIKMRELAGMCSCSGAWGPTVSADMIKDTLKLYIDVATFHRLRCVESCARDALMCIM